MVKIIKQTYGPWSNEENKVISNAIASGIIGKNWSQKEANRINHLLKKRSLRQIAAHLKEIQKKIEAEKTAEKIAENKPSVLPDYGWIYFASNPNLFHYDANMDKHVPLYKIGYTNMETPQLRLDRLYKTGLPSPFVLKFAKKVKHSHGKEQIIHKILEKCRLNDNREFFTVNQEEVRNLFNLIDGEWYNST